MSHQAVAWAMEIRVGDPTLKSLLIAIAHRADRLTWACWPSLDCLAYDTEVSRRTIQRRLDELVERGLIRIDRRRRPDGTQDNSLITITGGQIVTLSPPVDKSGLTGGQKQGSPVDTADHHNKQEEQEEQESSPPAKPQERKRKAKGGIEYTEQFENEVWGPYPRKEGTSKKKAFEKFRWLAEEDQALVIKTIPIYAKQKAGKDPEFIKHLQFFLSERIFDTIGISKLVAGAEPQSYQQFNHRQWEKVLAKWRDDHVWRDMWGPAPWLPTTRVPVELLWPHELSKPAVDSTAPPCNKNGTGEPQGLATSTRSIS